MKYNEVNLTINLGQVSFCIYKILLYIKYRENYHIKMLEKYRVIQKTGNEKRDSFIGDINILSYSRRFPASGKIYLRFASGQCDGKFESQRQTRENEFFYDIVENHYRKNFSYNLWQILFSRRKYYIMKLLFT